MKFEQAPLVYNGHYFLVKVDIYMIITVNWKIWKLQNKT